MKKLTLLLFLVSASLSAYQIQYGNSTGTPPEGPTPTGTPPGSTSYTQSQTYNQPTSNQSGQLNNMPYSTQSYQGQTPGTEAWHRTPNNENYYDDPRWPNIPR